ncbi:MAG: hypothetical protein ACT4OG_07200 [Alphaproteobacteria bacterium]
MKRSTNILIGLSVTLAVAGVLAFGFSKMCGTELVKSVASPDNKLKAVMFERDCGATTDFSTQVSILEADDEVPNSPGNTFIAEGARDLPRAAWGGPWAEISWRAANSLEVKYDRNATVFKRNETVGSVTIIYVPSSP